MKYLLVAVGLLAVQIVIAQTSISGRVVQRGTEDPVPYATIGLVKKNTGINADGKGEFTLTTNNALIDDTLIVSSVGYETLRIPVPEQSQPLLIELERKFIKLPAVMVKNKWQSVTLNDTKGCGKLPLVTTGFQSQVAQVFEMPVENAQIISVRLCIGNYKHYRTPFLYRIRIYGFDSVTGGPGEDLSNEVIERKVDAKIQEIDLSNLNINVPGKNFFVALEWVLITSNQYLASDRQILYGPGLGTFGKEKVGSLRSGSVWSKFYNGKWAEDIFYGRTTITARVKY